MVEKRELTPVLWWAVGAALLSPVVGVFAGRWIFPLVSTAAFYPAFRRTTRDGSVARSLGVTLAWVCLHSVTCIVIAHEFPVAYESSVLNGEAYRVEMFHWIETGEGPEGDPSRFIPIHALHFLLFAVLCAISRGCLGLLLGVLLLNYMNNYVGALTLRGSPWVLGVLGWHPWAILRVVGFLLAAILLARRPRWDAVAKRGWLGVGSLLLSDVLLKALLASSWREVLGSHIMD